MSERFNFVVGKTGADARPGGLILVAVLALTLFYYLARVDTIGVTTLSRAWHPMTGSPLAHGSHNLAAGLMLGLIPVLCARYLCGLSWRGLGLGLGSRKRGLVWLAIGIPVAILAAKFSATQPAMRAVSPLNPDLTAAPVSFSLHALTQFAYYGAWEVLFRGVLLFGLRDRIGFANANILQTALSVVAHFSRPFPETLAAIPAGLAFGGIAGRTRSIWYVAIIHWVGGTAQDWYIVA